MALTAHRSAVPITNVAYKSAYSQVLPLSSPQFPLVGVEGLSLLCKMVCYANIVAMTIGLENAGKDARQLLSNTRALMNRVHKTQRATWFPLLVFATITFLAIPIERYSRRMLVICGSHSRVGSPCRSYSSGGFIYWPVAFVLAYVAISAFYIRRSRAHGVETRTRPYVVGGITIAILLSVVSLWGAYFPIGGGESRGLNFQVQSFFWSYNLISPASAIGLALLVLARIERNAVLFAVDTCYLAIVLVPINFGWVSPHSGWYRLPELAIDGGVLLLAGIGFVFAQLRAQRPSA